MPSLHSQVYMDELDTSDDQGISLEAWTSLEKSPNIHLCKSQLILHHLSDHSPLWLWVLGTVTRYGEQNQFLCNLLQSCYMIMLNVKRKDCVSTTIHDQQPLVEPLVYCVRKLQLGFLEHILQFPDEEPAIKYVLYISSHGKRRPGRPRTF